MHDQSEMVPRTYAQRRRGRSGSGTLIACICTGHLVTELRSIFFEYILDLLILLAQKIMYKTLKFADLDLFWRETILQMREVIEVSLSVLSIQYLTSD